MNTLATRVLILFPCLALALFSPALPEARAARSRGVYEEVHRPQGGFFARRPAKDNPTDQLSHAKRLQNKGRLRRAARQYGRLVNFWPEAPEAPSAQFEYAQIQTARNNTQNAFDAYGNLLERYPNHLPYAHILDRMFDLAATLRDHRKAQFFIFPGFQAPSRAAPLFKRLVELGPEWERAPEALYAAGQAYDADRYHEEAALVYSRIQYRYPRSPYAEKASFAKALNLITLSRETPNDERRLQEAWAALAFYINNYPLGPSIEEARRLRDDVYRRRAAMAYERAVYYDRHTQRPHSALTAYQRFLQAFPQTEWSPKAEQRVRELRAKVND